MHEAASRCDAVLFLVSRAWLDSSWCRKEFHLAHRLNKRILGLLIEEIPTQDLPEELIATWQLVNLAGGGDHQVFQIVLPDTGREQHVTFSQSGLARLKGGLNKAGLDPRFFAWPPEHDPKRPPYRGMRPLEAEDAGIFFGREAPIVDLLATLRGMREAAPPRFLVILGASGSGKSSFLRAGILPRLLRDDRNFLTLPIIRPEQSVLSGDNGLLRCLEKAFEQYKIPSTRKQLRDALATGSSALLPLLGLLVDGVKPVPIDGEPAAQSPILVFSIDQGEELFLAEGATESRRFLELLRELSLAVPPMIIIFTIRSDSYERLQTVKALEGISQETYSLPPMPRGAYQTVIEGPAARLALTQRPLKIEPKLTETLLEDIDHGGGKDALPLLAFTLERLYLEYGGAGELRLQDYQEMGGIKGAIEAAVERAFRSAEHDSSLPRDRQALLLLVRRGLIPWLAGIDPDTQTPRRRVAKLTEIPAEARTLINHLIEQHLLATDVDKESGEITIEPAHEALLRQWGLLQGWLKEDFANLAVLDGVQRATRDWESNSRDHAWLNHTAGRLEDAERLKQRDDLARFLTPSDWAYLKVCREQDNLRRDRELNEARQLAEARQATVRRTRMGLLMCTILLIVALYAAYFAIHKANEAKQSQRVAEADRASLRHKFAVADCDLAEEALKNGKPDMGAALLVRALKSDPEFVRIQDLWLTVLNTIRFSRQILEHNLTYAAFSPEGRWVVTTSYTSDGTAQVWNAETGEPQGPALKHQAGIYFASFSPDGRWVVTTSSDNTVQVWNAETGKPRWPALQHEEGSSSAIFSPDGRWVIATPYGTVQVWNAETGEPRGPKLEHKTSISSAVFSPDGRWMVTMSDETAQVWNAETWESRGPALQHKAPVYSAAFSPDGRWMVTTSSETAQVWNAETWEPQGPALQHKAPVDSAAFSPDGRWVLTTSSDNTAQVWNAETWEPRGPALQYKERVSSAAFSPDGRWVLTTSKDGTVQVWNAETGKPLWAALQHNACSSPAVFSPDGRWVVTMSSDYTVPVHTAQLWNAETGEPRGPALQHKAPVYSAVFSPDGRWLLTRSIDNILQLWDIEPKNPRGPVLQHQRKVSFATFSPDGRRVVTLSQDKTVQVWNAETGEPQGAALQHKERVFSTTFSPDSRWVVTASEDAARVWDAETGELRGPKLEHKKRIFSAVFSPDGRWVVTASEDKTAQVWNAETGEPRGPALQHGGPVFSAVFSPDGRWVVTASEDRTARVWNAETGEFRGPILAHKEGVFSAVFSPDGRWVVTASDDKTARLWNAETGEPRGPKFAHKNRVFSAVFRPEGQWVVTASEDKTARVRNAET